MSVLDRLEALLAQATPPPWVPEGWSVNAAADLPPGARSRTIAMTRETRGTLTMEQSIHRGEADAALICGAVNALPALIACARELEHHACVTRSGTPQNHHPHAHTAGEGTSYCRACEALARLAEGEPQP